MATCFEDRRDPQRIEHRVGELVSQRVYALALGYEDLNDHDQLRWDPLLALLAGKAAWKGKTATGSAIAASRWPASRR